MLSEEKILDLIEKDPDWEETLVYIIMEKGMDPWDIDIVKLANVFSESLKKMKKFNFKVPARLIIISAVLLRMKVEILVWERNEGREVKSEEVEEMDLNVDISDIPDMKVPAKRKPRRKVTLDELTKALEKAFRTQDLRKKRKNRVRRRVEEAIPTEEEEDIEKRIDNLYERISRTLDDLKNNKITFSSLIPDWNREEIVNSFMPLLHLSGDGKVSCDQEKHFKEIFIEILSGKDKSQPQ